MGRTPKPWFYRQTGWWMVWLGGKKEKLAKGRKNKSQAQQRLLELRLESSKNPPLDSPYQTVASVIDVYLRRAEKRLAPSTIEARGPYLQSFAEYHGWRLVTQCKPIHLDTWVDDHPKWQSDWTRWFATTTVRTTFNWAAKAGLIPESPFKGIATRRGNPRRDMTRDEFRAILRATMTRFHRKQPSPGRRFREIVIFLWLTGCRPSEAWKLCWQNVDLQKGIILLPDHKTSRTQAKPQPRLIPIDPVVLRLLRSIKKRNEGEIVFLNHRLTPWTKNSLALRLRRARRTTGVPEEVKLYGIRHAFGTRAVIKGVDIKTLAELLGHTTTRMAEHYVHLAGQHEHLASAMRRVNGRRRDA